MTTFNMNRFKILKNIDTMEAHSASMSIEDLRRKIKDQKREAAQRRLSSEQRQRNETIRQFLFTVEGRQRLAASMVNPIRQRIDYNSIARQMFLVDFLLSGTLPIYPRWGEYPSYVINEENNNVLSSRRNRIKVPLFEIGANPQIPLRNIREQRYDLIERAIDFAGNQIAEDENGCGLRLLNASSTINGPIISTFDSAELVLTTFRTAFDSLERGHDVRVANIFLNPEDFLTTRRFLRDHLNQETHTELLRTGLFGSLWGAQMIVSQAVPPGEIYLTAEPEIVGRISVRQDITVLSADDPSIYNIGWIVYEEIGMACINPSAITRISINRPENPVRTLRNRFQLLRQT